MRAETMETTGITIARSQGRAVPRQLDGIQILRGIAASIVVFHHYCQMVQAHGRSTLASFRSFTWVGASGVDIFFCISGFVIVYSLLARPQEVGWRSFVVARIKRIVPLYWLFTLVIVALWASGRAMKTLVLTPDLLLRSLLLLPVTKIATDGRVNHHPILDQGWTLQYEALFYVACTLVIVLLGSRRVFPWTPVAVAAVAVLAVLLPGAPPYLHDPLMLEFVGGTLLGWLAATGRLHALPARRAIAWGCILLGAGALMATSLLSDPVELRVLVWGVPGFLLVLGCILVEPRRGGRIVDGAIFLGAASYSIYLAHGVITLFVNAAFKAGHFRGAGDGFLIIATVLTIAASAMVYPLIERPLTRRLP
ncbi:acyltransferase [Sphingomonas yunnanensis]|uniref:acyltransferase family protein n=1 Tax=Sphingomonas yunnanensis TaxID=310400 RepID=UPI001CA6E0C8|nr:acyltransferase [Sphingomonas yunnanensis]MBY9064149.1 acyltransferase [Sphingomonas yunnanensis]